MKRVLILLVTLLVLCSLFASCGEEEAVTLNVYNWGEYISDGSDESMDVNACFEEYYYETFGKKVIVNYTTYASNEDMYNKLKSGAASYDIVIPSEYMIQRMISEGMLAKLNFDNIPNYQYIDDEFKNLFYDENNEYSVPYTFGMVGVIYNSDMVDKDEADIGSWDLMWNEKYSGKILQFNNPRDAFGTAMYRKGIDVNTTDYSEWATVLEDLKAQKPLVQSYVMDEIFNKMKNGSAAISAYYAGDFLSMYDDNEDLCFFYPKEGTNVFVDAICIPECARHKDIAEAYINFLLSEETAVANAEYIMYGSPNILVRENEEYIEYMEEYHEDAIDILYGAEGAIPTSYYHVLDDDTQEIENDLWEELKIENGIEPWIHITSGVILLGLIALALRGIIIRRIRRKYYTL